MLPSNLRYVLVLVFALPSAVLATSLPWQEPYVGVYLGGGFGNNPMTTNAGNVTNTSYFATSTDIYAVNNAGTWTKEPTTLVGGIQAGHDWMWKQMTYGVVLSYGYMSLSSSSTTNNTYPDDSAQYSLYTSMQTDWLFTLRGRFGHQIMLKLPGFLYLTGGMAMTKLKVSNYFNDNSSLVGMSNNATAQNQIGWTVGTGLEMEVFHHISVDFEYLYIDVPSVTTISSISNTQGGFGIPEQSLISALSTTANFSANIFKIGLNYRFDES